jgi:hypothetical protein
MYTSWHSRIGRGVGTGGQGEQVPQVFPKCPFPGSKVPFSCVKNVIKIAFFAQRALLKTWIYVITGKFYSFPGKIWYIGKFFLVYPENVFIFLGKKRAISGKFFWYVRKHFLRWPPLPTSLPRRQYLREKIFRHPFLFEKCPSKPAPPPTFRTFLRPCA